MVTSGTGHDRCPSQLFRAHSAPGSPSPVTDKKIARSNLVSRRVKKNFGSQEATKTTIFLAPRMPLTSGLANSEADAGHGPALYACPQFKRTRRQLKFLHTTARSRATQRLKTAGPVTITLPDAGKRVLLLGLTPATAPKAGQFVLDAKALHGNPSDGHTLRSRHRRSRKAYGVAVRGIHIAATTIPTGSRSGSAASSAGSPKPCGAA